MTVTEIRPTVSTDAADILARDAIPSHIVNVWTDMPANLTKREQSAYMRGYSRGYQTYTRKVGAPTLGADEIGKVSRVELRQRRLDHEVNAHPTAVKAAVSELKKHLKKYADEARMLEVFPKPVRKSATRKPAKVQPAAPEVVEPAPVAVETVAETVTRAPMTYAARKASRRELAATMRAAGIDPRGGAWEAAKAEAGLS